MLFGAMVILLLCGGFLIAGLLALLRPRRALPLYVQVDDDAENIEWLFTVLLRQAPHCQLVVIDLTSGENKRILNALSRRYHLAAAPEAPPGAPVLYARRGVTAQNLLAQYKKLRERGKEKAAIS